MEGINAISSPTLTVYKASAGSGKTFRLSVEYIKLMLLNPRAYEGILAVTFTNKATGEMKMRILSQLYGIWRRLPDSQPYMNEVTQSLDITEDVASERAGVAIHCLLHNYHYFRVQTIDTFFQGILRNLARELQLNSGLRVGLNVKQVVDEAVDDLIDSVVDDKALRRSVMEYIDDNIGEGKRWDITEQLKSFGVNIFGEKYKLYRQRMDAVFSNPHFFADYKKKLRSLMDEVAEKYRKLGCDGLKIIADNGLTVNDFTQKTKGPASYFAKLANGQFADCKLINIYINNGMNDAGAWVGKSVAAGKRKSILALVESSLLPLMNRIESMRKEDVRQANTARLTLRHINDVTLLRDIEKAVRDLNESSQRFMLSDTPTVLNEIIDNGDSPFIFEKIGTRLEHIMIDEFQDTSVVQWANFKPLVGECMSHGTSNLIVGDVKQSIYRFRNGDWTLLNDIDQQFSASDLQFTYLKHNRRSERNVIKFNNAMLSVMASLSAREIERYSEERAESVRKAYADVEQDVPQGREPVGRVRITLFPSPKKDKSDQEVCAPVTYDELMLQSTLDAVRELVDMGARQNDIAILLRNNKHIPRIADYIEAQTNGQIKVVSAEAFRLDASVAVRIIINAMKVLVRTDDKVAMAALLTDYLTSVVHDQATSVKAFSGEMPMAEALPHSFWRNRVSLLRMPLHDLAERIVILFSLDSALRETAYISALFDYLESFCADNVPIIEDFIKLWDEELCSKTIEQAESDGINILSIHKSKGLEYDHVIIPYCDWGTDPQQPSTLWVVPQQPPFSELPVVPLEFRNVSSFAESFYEAEGNEEHIQDIVDNLNLIYVAMTRAGHSLTIMGKRTEANKLTESRRLATLSTLLQSAIAMLPAEIDGQNVIVTGDNADDEPLEVCYGNIHIKDKARSESANVFLSTVTPCEIPFCAYDSTVSFRQSNDSRRFADDEYDENDRNRMMRLGTLLHQVFASIRTKSDVAPVLRKMEVDGTLCGDGVTSEALAESLQRKFDDETVSRWYAPHWRVFNECSIITPEGNTLRPDRVITDDVETIVIDFKFGASSPKHKGQVAEYVNLLVKMGMPQVKGFVWYVAHDNIVSVE